MTAADPLTLLRAAWTLGNATGALVVGYLAILYARIAVRRDEGRARTRAEKTAILLALVAVDLMLAASAPWSQDTAPILLGVGAMLVPIAALDLAWFMSRA
jgi:hypothetical protein